MNKNLCGKMRDTRNPYEIWRAGSWEWHVLKKYQTPEKEASNPHARWFCLVKSPYVPEGELGDTYVKDITSKATKVSENY